ncbi:MAG TPA: glycine zipper domain-containing protein [Gammaproteobacteria bacterium]|jgi:outer membrane lipoprotein SlyB|nr:glycine zipper domain-containing protein [Gammaproteobacteria bacterium]
MKKLLLLISLSLSLVIVGCAKNISPNVYKSSQVGAANDAVPGVIVSKRVVTVDGNSGAGGLAGTMAGAAGGAAIGGSVEANIIAAIGGAVVGGLVGNAIDKSVNKQQAIEYIVRLNSGSMVSVVQALDNQLDVNQRVLVLYGSMTRLVADHTYASASSSSSKVTKQKKKAA